MNKHKSENDFRRIAKSACISKESRTIVRATTSLYSRLSSAVLPCLFFIKGGKKKKGKMERRGTTT